MKFANIIVRSVSAHFISTPLDLTPYLDGWTVVTGGTDGIGRAYIEELAKTRGVRKFYLIGRNKVKLEEVKKKMGRNFLIEREMRVDEYFKGSGRFQRRPMAVRSKRRCLTLSENIMRICHRRIWTKCRFEYSVSPKKKKNSVL
jgi:hypothetical protein